MVMAIVGGSYLGAVVLFAALLTYLAIKKWKRFVPPEKWAQSRFKYGRIVGMMVGLGLFIMAMLQLGLVARTFWANYFGEESHSADLGDIFMVIILTIFALALMGYEKLAGILFMEFYFSLTLGATANHFLINPQNDPASFSRMCIYTAAFFVVFMLGRWFLWSKGFALGGLLCVVAVYFYAYLTM